MNSQLWFVWIMRMIFYIVGLFILALGVSMSIISGLGVSPVSSIPYVFSEVLQVELGNMTIIVFSIYVIVQITLLRRDFKYYQLLQIICAILFGKFVTLTTSLISGWTPLCYSEKIIMTMLSTILIAIGIYFYLLAKIVPQAAEGLVQTIADKGGWKLARIKNIFDLISISVAAVVSVISFGRMIGLREGTVIAAVGVGRVLMIINKADQGRLHEALYGRSKLDAFKGEVINEKRY